MKLLPLAFAALTSLVASATMAQAPAGTPEDGTGSTSSNSGNSAPQQELETHKSNGVTRIQDGRKVNTEAGNLNNDGGRDDSAEHSGEGGPTDPSTTPGAVE